MAKFFYSLVFLACIPTFAESYKLKCENLRVPGATVKVDVEHKIYNKSFKELKVPFEVVLSTPDSETTGDIIVDSFYVYLYAEGPNPMAFYNLQTEELMRLPIPTNPAGAYFNDPGDNEFTFYDDGNYGVQCRFECLSCFF